MSSTRHGLMNCYMNLLDCWICVESERMPYCRQRNAHINFNQSCKEDGGGEMELIREIGKYLTSKKVAKSAIHKALKGMESQCTNKNQEILSMVSMLREAKLVTLSVLETLLSFIAGPKLRSKSNSWWFCFQISEPKKEWCMRMQKQTHMNLRKHMRNCNSYCSHYKKI